MSAVVNLPWRPVVVLIFLASIFCGSEAVDELVSARCQSKCLMDFETEATKEGIRKRQLKHMIIQLCRADQNCSSCARPCRESFESISACYSMHCQSVDSSSDCYKSCVFMNEIIRNRAGGCPKDSQLPLNAYANECISSCRHDGDCPTSSSKCCTNGCGMTCLPAANLEQVLLPLPTEVTAAERKRGRSAVVRWVMSRLRPVHSSTFSNLYIVQWRWGVRPDADFTPWQTIAIRNKPFAILKHLLSPGRYYKFRVAAVSVNGSLGFSEESDSFRLSRDPKAPGKPRNLAAGGAVFANGLIDQEIYWLPPNSDLPIVHYQLTWSQQSINVTSTAVPKMLNDSPLMDAAGRSNSSSDSASMVDLSDHNDFTPTRTRLIPGDQMSAHIHRLHPATRYLVEVHAIVQSATEEWHGEKASMYIITAKDATEASTGSAVNFENISPDLLPVPGDSELLTYEPFSEPKIRDLKIEKPYYQNGLLKAFLTWEYIGPEPEDTKFRVVWWPTVCLGSSFSEYSVSKPIDHIVEANSFELYDLQFGCHYQANVTLEAEVMSNGKTLNPVGLIDFQTPKCQDTPVKGSIVPNCPTLAPDVPSTPENLTCSVLNSSASEEATAECHWKPPARSDAPVTAYRVVFGQKLRHSLGIAGAEPFPSLDRNTVVIKVVDSNQLSLNLSQLMMSQEYVIQIQAVSKVGLGPAVHQTFYTPSLRKKPRGGGSALFSRNDEYVNIEEATSSFVAAGETPGRFSGPRASAHDSFQPSNSAPSSLARNLFRFPSVLPALVALFSELCLSLTLSCENHRTTDVRWYFYCCLIFLYVLL